MRRAGGEAGILRIEDLEVRGSIAEPQEQGNEDQDRDNLAETGSLDSSVHSHKDESDSSKKAKQVGDGGESHPVTPATPTKKDRKKKKKMGKSNEGEKQGETAADSESLDASSPSRPQPSA